MPEVLAPETKVCAETRRRMRLERQARVGLLRNPNRPPAPPPRRAALMGRWLNLRSSRRERDKVAQAQDLPKLDEVIDRLRASLPPLAPDTADGAGPAASPPGDAPGAQELPRTPPPAPRGAGGGKPEPGGSLRIDVEALSAAVEGIGRDPSVRAPFAAGFLADDVGAPPQAETARAPSIFSPEAWMDDDDDETPAEADAPERMETAGEARWWTAAFRSILRPLLVVLGGIAMAALAFGFLMMLGPVG